MNVTAGNMFIGWLFISRGVLRGESRAATCESIATLNPDLSRVESYR